MELKNCLIDSSSPAVTAYFTLHLKSSVSRRFTKTSRPPLSLIAVKFITVVRLWSLRQQSDMMVAVWFPACKEQRTHLVICLLAYLIKDIHNLSEIHVLFLEVTAGVLLSEQEFISKISLSKFMFIQTIISNMWYHCVPHKRNKN